MKRYISECIALARSSFLKTCTARLQMAMSQTFGVRKFFTQKLSAKLNQKRRIVLESIIEFELHQYHAHTMAAYLSGIRAKSTILEAQVVRK